MELYSARWGHCGFLSGGSLGPLAHKPIGQLSELPNRYWVSAPFHDIDCVGREPVIRTPQYLDGPAFRSAGTQNGVIGLFCKSFSRLPVAFFPSSWGWGAKAPGGHAGGDLIASCLENRNDVEDCQLTTHIFCKGGGGELGGGGGWDPFPRYSGGPPTPPPLPPASPRGGCVSFQAHCGDCCGVSRELK